MAKKLSNQSQASTTLAPTEAAKRAEKASTNMNWFGEHIAGEHSSTTKSGGVVGAGVGKYLKRAREPTTTTTTGAATSSNGVEPAKKKAKTGFGNFDAW